MPNNFLRELAAAEEGERRRIARELHDRLGQHLTGFGLALAELRRRAEMGMPVIERLDKLEELSRAMMRDARVIALELRPPELDDVGLESALGTYLEHWSERSGIPGELTIAGASASGSLSAEAGTVLFRIAQEALNNVAKYSKATHVSVILEMSAGVMRLVVEDDGAGFEVEPALKRARAEGRLGLAGMRERAALVGGSLDIESSPGKGAAIYVRVPLAGR